MSFCRRGTSVQRCLYGFECHGAGLVALPLQRHGGGIVVCCHRFDAIQRFALRFENLVSGAVRRKMHEGNMRVRPFSGKFGELFLVVCVEHTLSLCQAADVRRIGSLQHIAEPRETGGAQPRRQQEKRTVTHTHGCSIAEGNGKCKFHEKRFVSTICKHERAPLPLCFLKFSEKSSSFDEKIEKTLAKDPHQC